MAAAQIQGEMRRVAQGRGGESWVEVGAPEVTRLGRRFNPRRLTGKGHYSRVARRRYNDLAHTWDPMAAVDVRDDSIRRRSGKVLSRQRDSGENQ